MRINTDYSYEQFSRILSKLCAMEEQIEEHKGDRYLIHLFV